MMKTLWWMIILRSVTQICNVVGGSPVLSPDVIHSCSGENVTFTCVVTNGNWLYWQVDYSHPSWSDVSALRYSVADSQGEIMQRENNVDHIFLFNLTDNSRLTSTATTTVVDDINGTQVYCQDAAMNRATSVIQIVKRPPEFRGSIIVDKLTQEGNYSFIKVSWKTIQATSNEQYIITIESPNEAGANFSTSNTSILISVISNERYNISVEASNCVGSSYIASTTFIRYKAVCEYPTVGSLTSIKGYSRNASEGYQITYKCQSGLILDKPLFSTCQRDGSWIPDPGYLDCQNYSYSNNYNCSITDFDNTDVKSIHSATNGSLDISLNCSGLLMEDYIIRTVCNSEGIWNPDVAQLEQECKNILQKLNSSEDNFMDNTLSIIAATVVTTTVIILFSTVLLVTIVAFKIKQRQGKKTNRIMNIYAEPGGESERNHFNDTHLQGRDSFLVPDAYYYEELSSEHMSSVAAFNVQRDITLYAELEPVPNKHPLNMAAPDNTLVEYASLNYKLFGENKLFSHLSSKWHDFGEAVGMDEQTLIDLPNDDAEYCLQKVFEYWKVKLGGEPTWGDLAGVLETIELHGLSDSIIREHFNELDCEVSVNIGTISV